MELTTVSEDAAVMHDGTEVIRHDGLTPGALHELEGFVFRTLERPPGELLCRFATVNDVHFGETEAGLIEGMEQGPTFRSALGEEPYPEMMSRCATAEIEAIDPAAVIVKGDLTSRGTTEEYEAFLDAYLPIFGDRCHHIRGNHESYHGQRFGPDTPYRIDLPGVVVAMIDTSVDDLASGAVDGDTLGWLRDLATEVDDDHPILVMGHHHPWNPESAIRPEGYFGINPDDSERLVEVMAAHPNLRGYFCGHTHRNRVRRFSATRQVPFVEVAAVKEFPGAWAEYRVYEGGITQVVHRIGAPEALEWSEKTRGMYGGAFGDYAFGELDDRCFVVTAD
ncbi:MAG: metallophosphoesterase [Acidimicrobiia bacterium]|nr:metallophosphoesterase [Acidimicrobiia bacterium]